MTALARGGGRQRAKERVQALFRSFANVEPWPADRVERRDPASYRRPSVVMIRICTNPYCRHWTPTRLRYCVVCHATNNQDHSPCRS